MINPIFKNSFVYDYFTAFLKFDKRFPQSIVFEGFDTNFQYFFALELFRILNCLGDKTPNCTCTNCNWVKENRHPAFIQVTPVDFKDDGSKTVISVKQIEKVTSAIFETSDYHRFFIFSNVKTGTIQDKDKNNLLKYSDAGYTTEKEDWLPLPLNKKILQEEASNALLKSTEEAPNKVTFVFLCNNREDIISTIVSRSLLFKTPVENSKSSIDTSQFLKDYPNISIKEGINRISSIMNYADENNLDYIDILNSFEENLLNVLKNNFENRQIFNMVNLDIQKIQLAKKQLMATVLPNNVLENLFISISPEGRNL